MITSPDTGSYDRKMDLRRSSWRGDRENPSKNNTGSLQYASAKFEPQLDKSIAIRRIYQFLSEWISVSTKSRRIKTESRPVVNEPILRDNRLPKDTCSLILMLLSYESWDKTILIPSSDLIMLTYQERTSIRYLNPGQRDKIARISPRPIWHNDLWRSWSWWFGTEGPIPSISSLY